MQFINNIDEIKRKLRDLKKLEIKIRFGDIDAENQQEVIRRKRLVWDSFFNSSDSSKAGAGAHYSLKDIAQMSKDTFKNTINEYFFNVYYLYYLENGIVSSHLYDPEILKWMGLPPDATFEDIKKRFRELAKKYHPDTGGESGKFVELMQNYRKLIDD